MTMHQSHHAKLLSHNREYRFGRIHRQRPAFTQVEIVMSTVIVGVLMVASLSSVAASRRSNTAESSTAVGTWLAEDLMAEMQVLPTIDPTCNCGFGTGNGESGTTRLLFNDVDDYNGLNDLPPTSKTGVALTGFSQWSRSVLVERMNASDWRSTSTTMQGVYRITVTVSKGGRTICQIQAYRTTANFGADVETTSILETLNVL